jgi:hypothetical protein
MRFVFDSLAETVLILCSCDLYIYIIYLCVNADPLALFLSACSLLNTVPQPRWNKWKSE